MRKLTNYWLNIAFPLPCTRLLLSFIVSKNNEGMQIGHSAILLGVLLECKRKESLCYTLVKLKNLYRGEDDTYAKGDFETIR